MAVDLAIANGTIVTSSGRKRGSIGISGGRIVSITAESPGAKRTIDATDLLVFPGFIDGHVHFRDPAFPEKEDFTSGTRAAAKGGITSVFEMPMADVGTSTGPLFRERREHLRSRAVIDWGMWGGGGQDALGHIADMAAEGAVGYKTFAREIYAARNKNFSGTWATDFGKLFKVAREISRTGRLWSVHAEDYEIVKALAEEIDQETAGDTHLAFAAVRPPIIEEEPIARLLLFARDTGARLHIAHITSAAGVDLIRGARAKGLDVSAEACIPHLVFNETDIGRLGPLGHFTPRLRTEEDRRSLWRGLEGGWISMAASDHASYTRQDVEAGWGGEVSLPPYMFTAGSASTEFLAPLVLTHAADEGMSYESVARILSEGPAQLLGVWPQKGSLAVGTDADLTVVDPAADDVVDPATMESKAKLTAFAGRRLRGLPVVTVVRGVPVFEDGQVTADPGSGEFVRPATTH